MSEIKRESKRAVWMDKNLGRSISTNSIGFHRCSLGGTTTGIANQHYNIVLTTGTTHMIKQYNKEPEQTKLITGVVSHLKWPVDHSMHLQKESNT
jgi:hypothetical protein